jgi:hypothetical protein
VRGALIHDGRYPGQLLVPVRAFDGQVRQGKEDNLALLLI